MQYTKIDEFANYGGYYLLSRFYIGIMELLYHLMFSIIMGYAYDLGYSCFVDSHTDFYDFDFCECGNLLVGDKTCLCKERNCKVLNERDFYKLPDKRNTFKINQI